MQSPSPTHYKLKVGGMYSHEYSTICSLLLTSLGEWGDIGGSDGSGGVSLSNFLILRYMLLGGTRDKL